MLSTTCFYDGKLFGLGQLYGLGQLLGLGHLFRFGQQDGDIVSGMVKDFCGKSAIDNSMKAGDKCVTSSWPDSSKVDYLFEICPRNDCPNYGQHMGNPLGKEGLSCTDIFLEKIWRFCKFPMLLLHRSHRTDSFQAVG
jgi:hypothetical protein